MYMRRRDRLMSAIKISNTIINRIKIYGEECQKKIVNEYICKNNRTNPSLLACLPKTEFIQILLLGLRVYTCNVGIRMYN